jgi:hypothetical protein
MWLMNAVCALFCEKQWRSHVYLKRLRCSGSEITIIKGTVTMFSDERCKCKKPKVAKSSRRKSEKKKTQSPDTLFADNRRLRQNMGCPPQQNLVPRSFGAHKCARAVPIPLNLHNSPTELPVGISKTQPPGESHLRIYSITLTSSNTWTKLVRKFKYP